MDCSFKSLAPLSPMHLRVPARRSELPSSAQGLIVPAISKPALLSTWKWRAVSAAIYWPHAFWLKLAIAGSLRAALEAQSSPPSQSPCLSNPVTFLREPGVNTPVQCSAAAEGTSSLQELLGEKQQEDQKSVCRCLSPQSSCFLSAARPTGAW